MNFHFKFFLFILSFAKSDIGCECIIGFLDERQID
jgi:hypothetical protein